ncbi:hypothetical protein [Psychrobacter lutiphocae]|nr:hypothetical protein [Psychrobacter lutiphocae]
MQIIVVNGFYCDKEGFGYHSSVSAGCCDSRVSCLGQQDYQDDVCISAISAK